MTRGTCRIKIIRFAAESKRRQKDIGKFLIRKFQMTLGGGPAARSAFGNVRDRAVSRRVAPHAPLFSVGTGNRRTQKKCKKSACARYPALDLELL